MKKHTSENRKNQELGVAPALDIPTPKPYFSPEIPQKNDNPSGFHTTTNQCDYILAFH